jgi:hypothetical protein
MTRKTRISAAATPARPRMTRDRRVGLNPTVSMYPSTLETRSARLLWCGVSTDDAKCNSTATLPHRNTHTFVVVCNIVLSCSDIKIAMR